MIRRRAGRLNYLAQPSTLSVSLSNINALIRSSKGTVESCKPQRLTLLLILTVRYVLLWVYVYPVSLGIDPYRHEERDLVLLTLYIYRST